METNTAYKQTEQKQRVSIDLLSFDDIVTTIQPSAQSKVLSPHVPHNSSQKENMSVLSCNDNHLVGTGQGASIKKVSFQFPLTSKDYIQGDVQSTDSLSSNANLEVIFGPLAEEPGLPPVFEPSHRLFQASDLVSCFPVTNQRQNPTAPVVTAGPSVIRPSTPANSSRSPTPDLIGFSPRKESLPERESASTQKYPVQAPKLISTPLTSLELIPTSSPLLFRIPGDSKQNQFVRYINDLFLAESKTLNLTIEKTYSSERIQEILGKDIFQSALDNKFLLARTAAMDLRTVHVDLVSSVSSTRPSILTDTTQDIGFVASQQPTSPFPHSAQDLKMSNSADSTSSPPAMSSVVASPRADQVPLPTALATRTADDVFAELRRPLHVQPSQTPTNTKITSVDRSSTNKLIISNSNGSGHNDLSALEDDEEDEEEEPNQPVPESKRVSARRQKNADIFDAFLKEAQKRPKVEKKITQSDEAIQSTRWLIEQAEKQHIISSPRDYQLELFERAKNQNIIAVLDTGMFPLQNPPMSMANFLGTGKTFIAVLLLRYILNQELEDRAVGKPKRVSFFLVSLVVCLIHRLLLTFV